MIIPELKEWRESLQSDLEEISNKKTDILEIINICAKYHNEIQSVISWISDQAAFIEGIKREYTQLYRIRFGEDPPPPTEVTRTEQLLTTPQDRKRAVQEIALAISSPGSETSDKKILEELGRRSMKLEAHNPSAVVSTILTGFTSEFEKVEGKKGTFRRKNS